jgi:hypothetical protein
MDTGMDSRPSFETRAPESASALPEGALLKMRSEIYFRIFFAVWQVESKWHSMQNY